MLRPVPLVALLLSATLLVGCASTRPPRDTTTSPTDLSQLERWQARGRIGVSGGQSGGSGSFDWQQAADRAEVQIRGPAGIGSVHLHLDGERLKLETGDGQVLESEAAWDELESRLGATLPATNLRYWMLGLAAPGEHRWVEGETEGTRTLEQAGWRIEYQRYGEESGARVPTRIRAASGDARVRIVVDRWRFGQ